MGWFQPQPEEASLRPGASGGANYGTAASPPAASNVRRRSALVIALFSSLGGFLFGVDIGYISGVEVMASFRDDLNDGRPMDDATMGTITAIFALGALAAASPPANEALMRAMSRRSALVAGAATFCVGATIQGLSFSVPSVLVGRLVSGASIGVLSTNVPVYMSELAAADERGKLVAFYQLAITLGIMIAFWFSFFLQDVPHGWRISVLAQLLPGGVLAIGMTGMPLSPCGLVAQKQRGEALKVLQEIRPEGADVELELREIEAAHAEEMAAGEATWAEFCSGPAAKIGAVGMTSMLLQQLGGMNVFMFYGPRVCEAVGLSGFLFTAIAGLVNFVATFPALLLVDRYGRARLLQCSAVGMMVACFGLAMIGNFAMKCRTVPPGEDRSDEHCVIESPLVQYTAAGCIFLFIANFAYGWGPVPWVLCSEIFPMKYRAKGVGLTTSMSWFGTFVIGFFPPMLISTIGFNTFWVFFAINSAALGYAFWLPETRGRSLEQDLVLYFNAFAFCLFGLPHIFSEDGNLTEMGFSWTTDFMPRKAKLPTELFLLVTHTASILGVMQVTMALLCLLFATCTSDKGAKKLVIFVCLCSFAGIIAMQFQKPAGTGAEGSPATGPLPLIVAIAVPSLMGLF